jgi:photosystem II stability/assembly factor-like uncharacterized protein
MVTADGGAIYHRNGTNWTTEQLPNATDNLRWITGASANNVFVAGGSSLGYWNGTMWTAQMLTLGSAGGLSWLWASDNQHLWVALGSGGLYRTTNGGLTWSGPVNTGLATVNTVFGIDGDVYAGGPSGSIARSNDGGDNWRLEPTGSIGGISQIWGNSPTELYTVGGKWISICTA